MVGALNRGSLLTAQSCSESRSPERAIAGDEGGLSNGSLSDEGDSCSDSRVVMSSNTGGEMGGGERKIGMLEEKRRNGAATRKAMSSLSHPNPSYEEWLKANGIWEQRGEQWGNRGCCPMRLPRPDPGDPGAQAEEVEWKRLVAWRQRKPLYQTEPEAEQEERERRPKAPGDKDFCVECGQGAPPPRRQSASAPAQFLCARAQHARGWDQEWGRHPVNVRPEDKLVCGFDKKLT